VLAGDPARARHAADLYLRGFAKKIYVVRPAEIVLPPEVDVNRDILLGKGVPRNEIHVFEDGAQNTYAEAQVALATIPAGIRTVLVVTSPGHIRRARMIFTDVLARREIDVAVVATPDDPHPEPWWSNQIAARKSAMELIKTVIYALGMQSD